MRLKSKGSLITRTDFIPSESQKSKNIPRIEINSARIEKPEPILSPVGQNSESKFKSARNHSDSETTRIIVNEM